MLEQFIAGLHQAGLNLDDRELADILWLAVQWGNETVQDSGSTKTQESKSSNKAETQPTTNQESITADSSEVKQKGIPVYLDSRSDSTRKNRKREKTNSSTQGTTNKNEQTSQKKKQATKTKTNSQSLPLRVPAASALPHSLDIARALRPLMRKVPSRTKQILDEQNTAKQIAEARIWLPVLKSAQTRWLELALVIESTSSTAIWQQTIEELKQLLTCHGAFRDVRTWKLATDSQGKLQLFAQTKKNNLKPTPRSYRELQDPTGRRLIIVVSDCISSVWYSGAMQPILKEWSKTCPVSILQLLPERLWVRTALGLATPVQLRSLAPGLPNARLLMEGLDPWDAEELDLPKALKIPVITLEAKPLATWAQMVAGLGEIATPGFVIEAQANTETNLSAAPPQLSTQERVNLFQATASVMARRLAGLMAAVPVSLPVVNLIQKTMLPRSEQIHVAEVFMSGLLQRKSGSEETNGGNYLEYEFHLGIRDLLIASMPKSETVEVIEQISQYIAQKLGLSIREFRAVLRNPQSVADASVREQVLPFAELTAQTLRRLGGEYARVGQGLQEKFDIDSSSHLQEFSFVTVTVNSRGEITRRETKQARYFTEKLGEGIDLEMVYIPGGTFMMGSSEGEGYDYERPQHQVTVKSFFMGKFLVTQAQWRVVANLPKVERDLESDPSRFKGDNLPVERVSWYDAVEFCARLSQKTGKEYRLPSEAEWEYACRAISVTSHQSPAVRPRAADRRKGTLTKRVTSDEGTGQKLSYPPFYFGETITGELANYHASETYANEPKGEFREQTTAVGSFPPNAFGLYDMHGNVWEWCADHWHENYQGAPTYGSAWITGGYADRRMVRGGCWGYNPLYCRSAFRNNYYRDYRDSGIGFRVVRVAPRTP